MTEVHSVEGKTFLITGAASGLGAGYVKSFLKDGAKSVAILDIAEEKGNALVEELSHSYPGKVVFIKCDVGSEESIQAAFDKVVDTFGSVDVVINNAGILNDSPKMWRKQCEVNYIGLVSFTLKAIKHMSVNEGGKGGTIINVSSELALTKMPSLPIYSGTKAAVLHFSQAIAMDPFHEQTGIRVLTICFGATDTPLLAQITSMGYDDFGKEFLNKHVSDLENSTGFQKPESAVKGVVDIFKQGSNGSVWLATQDKPVKEITSHYNTLYETFS